MQHLAGTICVYKCITVIKDSHLHQPASINILNIISNLINPRTKLFVFHLLLVVEKNLQWRRVGSRPFRWGERGGASPERQQKLFQNGVWADWQRCTRDALSPRLMKYSPCIFSFFFFFFKLKRRRKIGSADERIDLRRVNTSQGEQSESPAHHKSSAAGMSTVIVSNKAAKWLSLHFDTWWWNMFLFFKEPMCPYTLIVEPDTHTLIKQRGNGAFNFSFLKKNPAKIRW